MPVQRTAQAYEKLKVTMDQLGDLNTKVGWFESAKYSNGTPVAYIAAIQELGWGPIPPRPYFRLTINKNEKRWGEQMGVASKEMLNGKETPDSVMEKLGHMVEGDVYKEISLLTDPPLSPITLELRARKMKGDVITGKTVGKAAAAVAAPGYQTPAVSDKPLVEPGILGGIMLATLTHVVERGAIE